MPYLYTSSVNTDNFENLFKKKKKCKKIILIEAKKFKKILKMEIE